MVRRNILLDVDGVIANFYEGFANYLNRRYNAGLDVHKEPNFYSFTEWNEKLSNIDKSSAIASWIKDDGFLRLSPYQGAREFVEQLIKLGNVYVVTARIGDWKYEFEKDITNQIKSNTHDWFKIHNIPVNNKITFSAQKVDLCLERGISIVIEDKLSTCIQAADNNINAIIINRGWNQYPDRLRMYRANSYNNILDFIRKLS